MQHLNPFSNSKTTPYHRISKEFSENDSDRGLDSGSATSPALAPKDDYENEKDYLIGRNLHRPRRSSKLRHTFCYLFAIVVSMLVGLVLGEMFRVEYEIDGYIGALPQLSSLPPSKYLRDVVWQQNDTFAQEPSAITEKAWADLIPEGRGFVTHPKLAIEMKSVSVFHEIHCLHGIRTAYFTSDYLYRKLQHAQSQTLDPKSPTDHPHIHEEFVINAFLEEQIKHPEHAHGLATGHVKHCFDYLRQALMCAADTNLEDTSVEDGEEGAPGWGSKRVCRDFDAVKEWSKKWREGDGMGIV
ncbi:uncharacterized protein K460DRAFT_428459 [Cucurbitaria berberidis CBS 394.84]|uniref:Tat pathway signal sequence n=1 Tax=Cucurbitaria berberidis CBS 394.84 TaxID=1168544 RepID=A0A9P4LBG4_9PLEO|nr:uncharacterized protein K460DRAFT_428459 [Cucurbitaria berberidis CBS 394.84]KAF1849035.1 hypothetical protein K460DRAFT_428459 [Cucurbitaria berberidis CBS 394.84]